MENRIRELREAAGLSLAELADACGSTPSTVAKLESGRMRLTIERVEQLAAALERDPLELLARPVHALPAADVSLWAGEPPPELAGAAARGQTLWRVESRWLDQLGLLPGDIVSAAGPGGAGAPVLATGAVLVAELRDADGRPVTVLRQFVAPSLLISNSLSANTVLNMRAVPARILGLVTAPDLADLAGRARR